MLYNISLWLVLYIIVCISESPSLYCPSLLPSPHWYPLDCSLYLGVCFFFVIFSSFCFFFAIFTAAAAAKSLQLCPGSVRPHRRQTTRLPPSLGFSRQEHWSGLPFPSPMHESEKWKWSQLLSRVRLLATPWTGAYQAPLSMGFAGQEYWSGCHCLPRYIH